MNFLNIFRGIITTLIGVALLCLVSYFFFFGTDEWEWHYYAIPFTIGIILLLMPDKIPAFVQSVWDKFILRKDAGITNEPKK